MSIFRNWYWRAAVSAGVGGIAFVMSAEVVRFAMFHSTWASAMLSAISRSSQPLGHWLILAVPMGIPTSLVAVGVYAGLTNRFAAHELRETRCRKCGYILRGLTEPRCSECGERI